MDISARNLWERLFSVMVLLFAMLVFSSIVASITSAMTALRNLQGNEMRQFWLLRRYLRQRSIRPGLANRIIKFQEKKLDTTKQPYELIWYQPISPSWMSSTRDMFGVDQVEVRAWHQVGKELKIETNVGEMKLTVRRTPDYFVEFIRMGETMLKSKTDVTPATFTTTIDTLFYLPSNSMLSKVFC